MSLIARLIEAGTPADLIEEVAMMIAEKRAAENAVEARKAKEAARTARYRKRGGGDIDPVVRAEVMRRDDYNCQDCGSEDDLCCDHIIPVSKGGSSDADNLQVLCRSCNSKKKDRIRKRDSRRISKEVHGQDRTSKETPLSLPPNEINSNPPTHTPGNTSRARKGHRLPSDWLPKPLTGETASMIARWPEGAVKRELAKFRDWAAAATGANSRKRDWDAAWRNWLRRRDEEHYGKIGNDNRRQGNSNRNAADMARAKLAQLGQG